MAELYQPELKEDYYVSNFHALAGFVVDTYEDLLLAQEIDWYSNLCSASEPAQRLFIRLLTRKRSIFRLSRLNYSEIDGIENAAAELFAQGLARSDPPDDLDSLLTCFTKPELLSILELSKFRGCSRVALTEKLLSSEPESQSRYLDRLCAADQWISIDGYRYWMLMQLCFFGNLYQDSSEFVLAQLGTVKYENYALERSARAFTSRQQIEAHWQFFECASLFDCIDQRNAGELLQLAASLPVTQNEDVNLVRRVDRLRNRIARQLERLAHYDDANTLYAQSFHPPARERRARLMMRKEHWQQASGLVGQMLDKPYNEAEQLVAQGLFVKCQKAMGISQKRPSVFKPASSKLVLADQGVKVEELARRYYSAKGMCIHTENTLINGVLGLFIWDIMFHPLPGVFFNPFQMAPADFYQPQFMQRRAKMLDTRFAQLNNSTRFGARIQDAFQTHYGKLNPLVRWHGLTAELLAMAVDRIPSTHWQALFQRILADPKENTSGFPDLVLFPEFEGYEFIEIKGPGDALQSNQRRWMQYFDQHGIACRLVHIRYRTGEPMSPEFNPTRK